MQRFIRITNGCENNLKNVNVEIEKGKFTVVTGVSGSGKSSLVYDTIFKESQRLYFSTFPSWSRKYLGVANRPKADSITGLDAAIAIDQKSSVSNPKSTVGTFSGIYDHLRLLFARFGSDGVQTGGFSRSLFSFNLETGWCEKCKGFGVEDFLDPDLIVADWSKSVRQRALNITAPNGYIIYSQVTLDVLDTVFKEHGFSIDTPLNELTEEQLNVMFYGSDRIKVPFGKHTLESRMKWTGITVKPREEGFYPGFINVMNDILKRDRNANILRFVRSVPCSECNGSRLNPKVLKVLYRSRNIAEIADMTFVKLVEFLEGAKIKNDGEKALVTRIVKMMKPLINSGLSYLKLSRSADSLSTGEIQRIRISALSESAIRGATFIFDEPTAGLHGLESGAVIELIKKIRDNGNTVIAVEHDLNTIVKADNIIETGLGGGVNGGNIIFSGSLHDFCAFGKDLISPTLRALQEKRVPTDTVSQKNEMILSNCSINNLKNVTAVFKSGSINAICGVSGSGKRSLMNCLIAKFEKESVPYIKIDRTPIGRTPRSNPATYTGISDRIRDIFASTEDAKKGELTKSHFSFNSEAGRCPKCEGAGVIEIGMKFMGSVRIVCELCNGKRFNDEVLKVKYKDKTISDVLDLSVEEAIEFFKEYPQIIKTLRILSDLGTGYLKLGQTSSSLSGGEAQRIKLATHLSKAKRGGNILFEEPATGLHSLDVKKLICVLRSNVIEGDTIFAIENNPSFVIESGHIVELGPDSGENGGKIVFSGSPQDLLQNGLTKTAEVIRNFVNNSMMPQVVGSCHDNYTEKLQNDLVIEGIETNNLKNITLRIKPQKLNVVAGVSGSGKTSLCFDTLFTECINSFLEGVSPYVKTQMLKKRTDEISKTEGLMAPVGISGKFTATGVRSTAGTVSGLYEILRMLYSRAGTNKNGEPCRFSAGDFSFNSETGSCEKCHGTAVILQTDIKKIITNPEKSFINGAMNGTKQGKFYGDVSGQFVHTLIAAGNELNIDFSKPVAELSENELNIALFGVADREFAVSWHFKRGTVEGTHNFKGKWVGFANLITDEFHRSIGNKNESVLRDLMEEVICPECNGKRLRKELLEIKFAGTEVAHINSFSAIELKKFIDNGLNMTELEKAVLNTLKPEMESILNRLIKLGLSHISIDRATSSMSLGERERLKLAKSCHDGLTNIIYIIDEPSRGVSVKESENIVSILRELVEKGNTVVAVEHEPAVIKAADHIIELGPASGQKGGEIIFEGTVEKLIEKETPTALSLKFVPEKKMLHLSEFIEFKVEGPRNLKKFDLKIPLKATTVITGVSGSGKTTLLKEVIAKRLAGKEIFYSENRPFLSTTKLSTVATITGLSDLVKKKFGKGFKITKDDLCKSCGGSGFVTVSLDYISDSESLCPDCEGSGYRGDILNQKYNGKNIYELLSMEVDTALRFFADDSKVLKILNIMNDCGLGYLHLDQQTNSLSTGEVQRLSLAVTLSKFLLGNDSESKFFLFDEPSTGLHFSDITHLLRLFRSLNEKGHTVIIAEHRNQIIQSADYIVELGPGSGKDGGELLS